MECEGGANPAYFQLSQKKYQMHSYVNEMQNHLKFQEHHVKWSKMPFSNIHVPFKTRRITTKIDNYPPCMLVTTRFLIIDWHRQSSTMTVKLSVLKNSSAQVWFKPTALGLSTDYATLIMGAV